MTIASSWGSKRLVLVALLGACASETGQTGPRGDSGAEQVGGQTAKGDSGAGEQEAPPWSGSAHVVVAPGNAVLRSASYRMQVQLGLSLSPQQSRSDRYRLQGASAVVIRESQP